MVTRMADEKPDDKDTEEQRKKRRKRRRKLNLLLAGYMIAQLAEAEE